MFRAPALAEIGHFVELLAALAVEAVVTASIESPRAALCRHSRSTPGAWRGSLLVRMKSSNDRSRAPARSANRSAFSATNASTGTPFVAAAATFFSAFSSVPVRNRTG